ncbi:MAG: DUF2806 domain-containing protein [Desulfovibrionaceae bacterium]|nr:DUF2806 domain-containing protein [Desulfovibrionaceae bacterium]
MNLPEIKVNIDVKADLTQAFTELSSLPGKGAGKVWAMLMGDKENLAEYRRKCLEAKAERDSQLIRRGELDFDPRSGKVTPTTDDQLMPLAYDIITLVERQQETASLIGNLRVALARVQEYSDEQVSDEPVAPDWFTRWRHEAKMIGNPEMQMLWGRILAEEVVKPQTISLRTLDVLKNLTPIDAHLFCYIARLRLNTILVCTTDILNSDTNKYGLNTDASMRLIDAGLVSSIQLMRIDGKIQSKTVQQFQRNDALVSIEFNNKGTYGLVPGLALTNAGREIAQIADIAQLDASDLQYFAECIAKANPTAVIRLHAVPIKEAATDIKCIICEYKPPCPSA